MVKKEELRIGNCLKSVDGKIIQTSIKGFFGFPIIKAVIGHNEQIIDFAYLDYIPLTRKHLENANFNFKELGFNDLSVSYGLTSKDIHFVIGNYYHKLEYLHELQNMYYDFTKKELTFKN
jgi:hypothetical protein